MIKQYKDLRATVKQSRQKIRLEKSNGISDKSQELEIELYKTTKKLIFKRCAQYYKYKKLFYNYSSVNCAAIIEFGQSF